MTTRPRRTWLLNLVGGIGMVALACWAASNKTAWPLVAVAGLCGVVNLLAAGVLWERYAKLSDQLIERLFY